MKPLNGQNLLDFTGKKVFVAGGSSGINLGIAEGFAACGATVGIMSRSADRVAGAVDKLRSYGGTAEGWSGDVRDYAAVEQVLGDFHGKYGSIDVLVSGAAGNFPAPAVGISSNGFKSVMDIDLLGTFHVLRAAHAFLTKPGASIINISAPQAFNAMEYQVHVCAAKAGVDMVTRVLAMEWGPEGIRVNSIVPGPIAGTEGMARLAPGAEAEKAVLRTVPMRRMGQTEDIARAAIFLASDLAAYVSGTVLPVDGGWSLAGSQTYMSALTQMMAKAGKA
ncbi:MAG TPA: SDR family oxidoreductase [Alphaproteobacteria bacterium]|nr:SDR family oxidoreductase [Alphaproteobacteria bacterium]